MKRRELIRRACLTVAAAKLSATSLAGCHAGRALTSVAEPALSPRLDGKAPRSGNEIPGDGDEVSIDAVEPGKQASGFDWSEVRRQFDLAPNTTHLGSLLLSSHPRPVREAIDRHRKGLDRNPVQYWRDNNVRLRRASRAAAAAYWGVSPEDLALTESTTQGLATLYNGLHLKPGDHVVTTVHDHPATRNSLLFKAERSGAHVEEVTLYDGPDVTEDSLVGPLLEAITHRTRIVALTWVHSNTGVKLPIRAISDALETVNADRTFEDRVLLCVDGVHGFGVEDTDMAGLGADFFAAGCHKWIFGPRGTGILCAADRELWDRVSPTIPSFGPLHTPGGLMSPGGFHAFEHRWSLPEAFDFVRAIGKRRIAERTHALARQLKEGLSRLEKITLHTPMDSAFSSGIVCFEVEGWRTDALVERMWEKGIVITESPYDSRYARVTPSIVNTPEDVETVLRALREL